MSEKRRHARVVHEDVVWFDGAGTTVECVSVDLSRNGIQVKVAIPQTFDRVEIVRFSLPEISSEIKLPVRVARRGDYENGTEQHIVAFEFLHSADQQLRLIENYIHETKRRHIIEKAEGAESRRVPRLDCSIEAQTDSVLTHVTIDNLTPEGLLICATGELPSGTDLVIEFVLPGDERPLRVDSVVAYNFRDSNGRNRIGVRFREISAVSRARISTYIEKMVASQSLASVRQAIESNDDNGYWLDATASRCLLESRRNSPVYILVEGTTEVYNGSINTGVIPDKSTKIRLLVDGVVTTKTDDAVFISFTHNGSIHYFSSKILSIQSHPQGRTELTIVLPEQIYQTDNRSIGRQPVPKHTKITLYLGEESEENRLVGTLVDTSWRGFLAEFTISTRVSFTPKAGMPVTYSLDSDFQLPPFGRVRHVSEVGFSSGETTIQIGVEAGVWRGHLNETIISDEEWEQRMATGQVPVHEPLPNFPTRRISFLDRQGRQIVALENRISGAGSPVVVIIPPAFGKKKETLAPLAAALCINFARVCRSCIVLRFDGINRPGESFNRNPNPPRGYEMLGYRPSQGVEDMHGVLDFVYKSYSSKPASVILITTSMSSVDARKLLLKERERVHAWVSLMGVPAGRTTLMNVLAGTDVIANTKAGLRNGVRGMLGHFVDMDQLAQDLIEEKYAFLTDARFDLARIRVPVLWILGEHDHWVDPKEVEDIMSVDSGASRELIRIPAGHNLRSSQDAAEAFRIIAEYCTGLAGTDVPAITVPRSVLLQMISEEREAVYKPLDVNEVSAYWHSYLVGDKAESEGYDFYGRLTEFRAFLHDEIRLLELGPGQSIADMGCGTGLLTREILRSLAGGETLESAEAPTSVLAVDLVPDALARTEEKCRETLIEYPALSTLDLSFRVQNLEPSRLAPLKDFLDYPQVPLSFLKGRIEGLSNRVIDTWEQYSAPELASWLRGGEGPVPGGISDPEIAQEIYSALRYLRGNVRWEELTFRTLNFGPVAAAGERVGEGEADRFDRLIASLFISYILNPDYLLADFHRKLKPGGRIVLSSMRPDSDVSKIFTEYIDHLNASEREDGQLTAARSMLNEAAGLLELEEDGYFRFYSEEDLYLLLKNAGFQDIQVTRSLGTPAQAYIASGTATGNPPPVWQGYV